LKNKKILNTCRSLLKYKTSDFKMAEKEKNKIVARYLPTIVHGNVKKFLKHRNLKLVAGSIAKHRARKVESKTKDHEFLDDSTFTKAIQIDGYVVIEAKDSEEKDRRFRKQVEEVNRKRPTRTYIVIIDMESTYAAASPKFLELMKRLPGFDYDKREYNIDIIIISQNVLSSHIQKKIAQYSNDGTKTAGFCHITSHPYRVFSTYLLDPNHKMVPPHRIISKEEEVSLLKSTYSEKKFMAKIPKSDPPVVWIGGEVGDVIEIKNPSESTGVSLEYRVVIPR
jgi:DNA-directed RNA polymerase subunit H